MGCGVSVAKPVQPFSDTDIFLKVSADAEKLKLKVLLLGTGESGKSTFVKQMKLLEGGGEYRSESSSVVASIRWNAIESIQILLLAAKSLGIRPGDDVDLAVMSRVQTMDEHTVFNYTEEFARAIQGLWTSAFIREVYARRHEFWTLDATPYYMTEVVRFFSDDFVPNDQDIVMMRTRTLGIVSTDVIEKPYKFQLVDVGGQRSERRKWIHCFDDVKAVVYMSALSGYNQVLFEDPDSNVLRESIHFFDETMQNSVFQRPNVYVFLNKKDLFERMIRDVPLTVCFPEYAGPHGDVEAAIEFIMHKFRDALQAQQPGRTVEFCVLSARSKDDVRGAFDVVKTRLKQLHPVRKVDWHRHPERTRPESTVSLTRKNSF